MQSSSLAGYARAYTSRARDAERESSVLVAMIMLCLFALPIQALSPIRPALYVAILVLELLLAMVLRVADKGKGLDMPLLAISGALFAYLACCWAINGGDASERLLQTALYLLTLVVLSRFEWKDGALIALRRTFVILLIACLLYWAVSGRVTNYYSAFYHHSNGFANVCFAAFAVFAFTLPVVNKGSRIRPVTILPFLLSLVLLIFANSRSALLALFAFLICVVVFRFAGRKESIKKTASILFLVALAGVLAFTIVYPSLLGTELGTQLELMSREYLNKNFFSGREEVWKMVLNAVQGHELLGLGLSMTPSDIYNTTLSAHNLYLQTLLQSGVVGLFLVLALLYLAYRRLSMASSWSSCIGAALIVALLVHECFEVALTQNNFIYGLMYWAVIAIALSISNRTSISEEASSYA